mmetsp:Transcript_15675/g.27238  ORF Transcript_15675/g.27238 Transcript_15675/m.27238 type:complete len:279 (+) Transcript_15675:184-1020(+)
MKMLRLLYSAVLLSCTTTGSEGFAGVVHNGKRRRINTKSVPTVVASASTSLASSSSSSLNQEEPSPGGANRDSLFEMDGWKNIADDLDKVPLFSVATAEGIPVAYQVTLNDDKTFSVPFFFCDVDEALGELETAKSINSNPEMRLVPFPLGTAFKLWCTDKAVIVPSKASIAQAGAPPGTSPIGQKVPMWACLDISEQLDDGKPRLPIFMDLNDANEAVREAVGADGGKVDDFEVVCLSLSGAIEQLATVPEESPSFHFIPPTSSMKYVEKYHSATSE